MRTSGFTLIELMIVVAIIGILSALAIPDFMKMIAKTKQSEAKTNLGAIYTSQIAYFAESQTYAGKSTPDEDAFELIGWHPESEEVINYAYILDEAVITGPRVNLPSGMPSGIASTRSSFTVIAAGNVDSDPTVDIWTMNDAKDLDNTTNDVSAGSY